MKTFITRLFRNRTEEREHARTTVTIALYRTERRNPSPEDVNAWMATRLPEQRMERLILAGIPVEQAKTRDVRKLSDEDLSVMAALKDPVPEYEHMIDYLIGLL